MFFCDQGSPKLKQRWVGSPSDVHEKLRVKDPAKKRARPKVEPMSCCLFADQLWLCCFWRFCLRSLNIFVVLFICRWFSIAGIRWGLTKQCISAAIFLSHRCLLSATQVTPMGCILHLISIAIVLSKSITAFCCCYCSTCKKKLLCSSSGSRKTVGRVRFRFGLKGLVEARDPSSSVCREIMTLVRYLPKIFQNQQWHNTTTKT